MSFARKFGETVTKRVVQETAEATGNLTENEIADKITSAGKRKSKGKEKEDETSEIKEICIPPEKLHKIIKTLRYNRYNI